MLYAIIIYYMWSVCFSKNDGVSPILGTILILAMTTVFVGIIGAAVVGGFGMAEPAPILGATIDHQGNIIMITHLNGDVLHAGGFKIMVDGVDRTAEFGATGDFGPGMTLSWDSGINPVGTVSIVCTSGTGVSLLITDKKFGKVAGAFEDRYSINNRIAWKEFVGNVADGKDGTMKIGTVYVDMGGTYWVCIKKGKLEKEQAQENIRKGISIKVYTTEDYYDKELLMIDLSKKIYTISDWNTEKQWKSAPYPDVGSLYEYKGILYINTKMDFDSSPTYPILDPTSGIKKNTWMEIATVK